MIRKRKLTEASSSSKQKLFLPGSVMLPLVRTLLLKWAWGVISASVVQELAYDAKLSGLQDDELDSLASIGGYGQTNKAHRDLCTRYCKNLLSPEPITVQIPAVDPKGDHNKSIFVETNIFLPSQWLRALQADELEFEYAAMFGIEKLEEYWKHQQKNLDPKWKNHPVFKKPRFNKLAIPILLHGDGASFQMRDSLMTVSFVGLLKEGSTLQTNLILASWPKTSCSKQQGGTWDCIWRWLVWDLNQLFENKYALTDPWGEALPEQFQGLAGKPILENGHFVVVAGVMGDNDFFQNDLGCPHWRNELPKPCCWLCEGNKVDKNWFDFRPTASWRSSPAMAKSSDHPINDISGFTGWHFCLDWMHTIDLGVAAHACGNIIFSVVYDVLGHKTRSSATQEVAGFLMEQTAATEHGNQLSQLDLKNFVTDIRAPHTNFPEMQKMKAAEIRALVPAVALLAEQHKDLSEEWGHNYKMIESLHKMYQIIYGAGMFLTPQQFSALEKHSLRFLLEYSFLSNHALSEGKLRFSVTPKFHYLCHIVQQSQFINPRTTWCYGGEDLVGAASALAHSCTSGTNSWFVASKMLEKYRVAKHMDWSLQ